MRKEFKMKTRRKKSLRSLCLCGEIIFFLIAAGCLWQAKPAPQPPVKRRPVKEVEPQFESEFDRLVYLLSHRNFDRRVAAHKKLVKMGEKILLALEEAIKNAGDDDHRRQIELVMLDLASGREESEKRGLLVILSIEKKSFRMKSPIEVTLEVKNTGNVPLEFTVPLLRKRSVGMRLDWTEDMSFMSGGQMQQMSASGKILDEWLKDDWTPSTVTVAPGDSLKQEFDITDLCTRAARYSAIAVYWWEGVSDFMSNAVTFEVTKPPRPEQDGEKKK